ncbi:NACHT domain-containing protein [Chitinophaga arvensicola]|uniref:NACHT domain-containing protein n=1 Tax=Chitinophaga arvensicola TaxID=29529 RepID=A0A1I0SBE8_9BACT|nr:NACHT domain-containing protein [Chitinophaga arvensicola]SEW53939.1 NACHT domain-containing protein [Chitinophaga arvensicola]
MIEVINDLLKGPIEKLWRFVDREVAQVISNRLLEYQVAEYNRSYRTKTILHRVEPVKLLDFYQPLFIRPSNTSSRYQKIPTNSVKELFKHTRAITILGTAGSGKSTIVKYLLINCIQEAFKIPIRIELRYLNKYNGSLHKYIEEEIFGLEQLSVDQKVTKRLLHSGDFLFFFDGYDELSSSVKEGVTKDISDFTRIYPNNLYLLTSRPYTNIELLADFSNFEVCKLSQEEIEQFVRKQISINEKEIVERIMDGINTADRRSYATFLSNPLLLTMFILTFQTYSTVPPKRSAFYKQVFDSLFHLHDSMSKLSYDREKKSGLSKEQFEQVLKLFSFITFFSEVFVFDPAYLESVLNTIKETKKNLQFENEHLIDDLQIAICILYKEGVDYVFPHRSLQEYFSSLYVTNLEPRQKNNVYKKLLQQFLHYDTFSLTYKDNFFTLLIEQDPIGVIRHFSLPFLERMEQLLSQPGLEERPEKILMTLTIFAHFFCRNDRRFDDLLVPLGQYNIKRQRIYLSSIDSKIMRWHFKDKVNEERKREVKNMTSTTLAKIKPAIPQVIELLKADLKHEIESDNSIIGMV